VKRETLDVEGREGRSLSDIAVRDEVKEVRPDARLTLVPRFTFHV
jgi:hypothetical protein